MEYEKLFFNVVSEKQYLCDLEKGKRIVDLGVKDYFLLFDSAATADAQQLGNTSLKDIIDVFGIDALEMLTIAQNCNDSEKNLDGEYIFTMKIRRLRNRDKNTLRSIIRFFPADTYVCEWRDANGCCMVVPFIQNEKCEIIFLTSQRKYTKTGIAHKYEGTYPYYATKKFIESIPDYFSNNLTAVRYKGVDIIIPIRSGTAKTTFKNREKENGVRKRIIHDVKTHGRKNLKTTDSVDAHVRGTSKIRLNGNDILVYANWYQASLMIKKELSNNKK